jgi:TPR repeat protein
MWLSSGLLYAQNSLSNVVVASRPQGISVTIDLSTPVVPQTQRLTNPNRLLFDFPGLSLHGPSKRIPVNIEGINDVRVALNSADPPLTRIVVDSSQPLNFELKPAGNRLVIELTSASSAPTTANAVRPSTSTGQDVATQAASAPVDTPQAETPKKTPAPMVPADPSAQSSATPSAYMLQAKARELKLEELQPLEDKAQAGDPEAETTLGLAYHAGTLLKKDDAEAERWLHRAADQSFMAAEESLGIFAETGVGRSAPAAAEAIDWYKKAIAHGSVDAATSLGLMYADGIGMPKDAAQAVTWFRQGAEGGDAVAQYNLALMYKRGSGVPQDDKEYLHWLTAAADQNLLPALLDLAGYYARPPEGVPADIGRATQYFEKAGELGNARAEAILGNIFAMGLQGKPDYEQAVKWYRMAADQGQADGEFGLGLRYALGQGVPLDLQEARRLFTAAADQGQINAQYDLGTIYEEGNGVPVDRLQAAHDFQLAADQGMPRAQFRLGRLLAADKNSSDQIAAYKWLMLAQKSVEESSPLLNDLRKVMSPQDVAEGERGVDSWRIAHR